MKLDNIFENYNTFRKVGASKGVVGRSISPEDLAASAARKKERDAGYAAAKKAKKNEDLMLEPIPDLTHQDLKKLLDNIGFDHEINDVTSSKDTIKVVKGVKVAAKKYNIQYIIDVSDLYDDETIEGMGLDLNDPRTTELQNFMVYRDPENPKKLEINYHNENY